MRHGGKILIDQLEAQGVTSVFLVPGETFLAALDALYDSAPIRTIICRHEGGAAMMAQATGKLTGKPGIAFATRGPGAANAASGLLVAREDQTPMILFVGLPATTGDAREASGASDVVGLFSPIAKWAAVVRDTLRIPELVARAFHVAMSGRPGPVVLGLPEDVLNREAGAENAKRVVIPEAAPSAAQMDLIEAKLRSSEWPLMIVGGPGWSPSVAARIEAFALGCDLPVAAAFRAQDYVDNRHPCYVGHAGIGLESKLAAAIRGADLLLAVGAHLGPVTTAGHTLVTTPDPRQFLVHVHPSAEEAGLVCRADVAIAATVAAFADALRGVAPPREQPWRTFRRDLRAAYEASLKPVPTPGDVALEQVVATMSEVLPEQAIVASGAGNYAQFLHRYFVYKGHRTQLAPGSGSMGYGLPAAIAAKLLSPERPVVAVAGDGCFQMTAQELATAVQYALPIVIIVANNAIHGSIRMRQEERYPGRVIATSLVNPDFAALAQSFGALGETVARTADFEPALRRALSAGRPALIDLRLDPEAIAPGRTPAAVRVKSRD